RITLDHPLLGVGPDRFQSAFHRAKPPICPEDVSSAHHAPLDFIATLGLGGLAWAAMVIAASVGLARVMLHGGAGSRRSELNDTGQDDAGLDPLAPTQWRLLGLAAALPALAGAYTEMQIATIEGAAVRIFAAASAVVVLVALVALGQRRPSWLHASCAMGLWVVLLHGLLDVTLVWPNAAPWMGVAIGLACVMSQPGRVRARPAWPAWIGAAGTLSGAGVIGVATFATVLPWESRLRDAGRPFGPLREATLVLSSPTPDIGTASQILGRALGRAVPPNPASVQRALGEAMSASSERAIVQLQAASDLMPGHLATARALGRTEATFAGAAASSGLVAARRVARVRPGSATAWNWLAQAERLYATGSVAPSASLDAAIRSAELSPYDWTSAARAARALEGAGEMDRARIWAQTALDRAPLSRLDPLRLPSASELTELEEIVKAP
ncbi:MAG: hypothetical protein AAGK04_09075, partial [Planctomycetota bacterium]